MGLAGSILSIINFVPCNKVSHGLRGSFPFYLFNLMPMLNLFKYDISHDSQFIEFTNTIGCPIYQIVCRSAICLLVVDSSQFPVEGASLERVT